MSDETSPFNADLTLGTSRLPMPRYLLLRAMSTLIRHDALDLAPMLFGPIMGRRHCIHCGRSLDVDTKGDACAAHWREGAGG